MDGGADRPGPRPELGGHQAHAVERRRVDALEQLGLDGAAQQVEGGRDAAADDDHVGRDDRDHVGDADAQVAPDEGEADDGPRIGRTGRLEGRLGGLRAAGGGDAIGPGEGLQAAAVAAAAQRAVGVERLMAELAARPVVALVDVAIDGDDAPDAGAQRQPDHRGRPRDRRRGGARPARRRARR